MIHTTLKKLYEYKADEHMAHKDYGSRGPEFRRMARDELKHERHIDKLIREAKSRR